MPLKGKNLRENEQYYGLILAVEERGREVVKDDF